MTAVTLTGPLRRNVNGASRNLNTSSTRKKKKRLERAADAMQRKSRKMAKPPKRMGSSEWMLYKGVAAVQQGHVQSNKSSVMSRLEHLDKKDRPDELPQVSMKLPDAGRIRARNAA